MKIAELDLSEWACKEHPDGPKEFDMEHWFCGECGEPLEEKEQPEMLFYEVGLGTDELTRFCMASTNEEARNKFIQAVKHMADDFEPGWEEHVWAQEINDRWID